MRDQEGYRGAGVDAPAAAPAASRPAPGQRALTDAIQRRATGPAAAAPPPADGGGAIAEPDPFDFSFSGPPGAGPQPDVLATIASHGTQGTASPLPYLDEIQRSFGHHDMRGVETHQGGDASLAARALGADAFATGNQVAFDGAPSLHTAAHEAAHVVQQRRGVHLAGGIDGGDDQYERHADQVADRVVRGESAEGLLDQLAPTAGGGAPIQRHRGKWLACGLLALGGVPALIGGVVTGSIPLVVLGGLSLLGSIGLGVSARRDDRRDATIGQFGNQHRDLDIDPDHEGEGGQPRPDDAPIVSEFRPVYNQLQNWKMVIQTRHPEWYDEFIAEFFDGEDQRDFGADVKNATKAYKTQFRNLNNDPQQVSDTYRNAIAQIQTDIQQLIDRITLWYAGKTGQGGDDVEQGLLGDDHQRINDEVHDRGTETWRQRWQQSIVRVNSTLARMWPASKARLRDWVDTEKDNPDNAAADMTGPIGELDYIGSLAKGVKGPPKQHIRFDPDNFDVDANLRAPPLSNYAMQVKGKVPDRQRIFGRASEIPPLLEIADEMHQELVQIPGIVDDDDDKFDIALEASDTPQQAATSEANAKLWQLRQHQPQQFQEAVEELRNAGFLTDDPDNYKLDEDADRQQVKQILDNY